VIPVAKRCTRLAVSKTPKREAGEEMADFGLIVAAISLAALVVLCALNPQIRAMFASLHTP